MKAILLAAGRGSRLGAMTELLPKCLIQLQGRPLIHWQIESLKLAGVDQIGVVRGYMAEKISLPGLKYFTNPRWSQTNMVMSLVCAAEWLEQSTCLVSYTDIVYPPDTVRRLIHGKGDIVITYDRKWLDLWSKRFENPLADAETFRIDERGTLVEIGNPAKNIKDIQGQYMGLLKFTPRSWEQVTRFLSNLDADERDRLDMTGLLQCLINKGILINTVGIDGQWCEIDSPDDLDHVHLDFISRKVKSEQIPDYSAGDHLQF